jgi:molybdopterin-synthase adenylyltransferase
VRSHWTRVDDANLPQFLAGSSVVVDGLDNIKDRLVLDKGARGMGIPLVHGALAGFDGQIMTIFPEDRGLTPIYGHGEKSQKDPGSPEAVLGVPALMPSVIATFQCMEVIKILLGRKGILRNTMLHIGLATGELNRFRFE